MKTGKYFLLLAVVTGILCAPAWGQEPAGPNNPVLTVRDNPALAGIQVLYVFIVPPSVRPNEDNLLWERLRTIVERKLIKSDTRLARMIESGYAVWPSNIPVLRVDIDILRLDYSQRYVFRIQTSLAADVFLERYPARFLKVDVWTVARTIQVASAQNEPAAITSFVLGQVETFITAWLAANPQPGQSSDSRTGDTVPLTVQKKRAKPATKSAVAEYKYVASKNSRVFHRPDCSSAKRIKPKNIIGYNSRGEAEKAGKRPCKRCKP
ncbi:MAG TPA: hypothetical protein ENH34_05120 [Phycisphaerales bacterium]|nr:hypothetical protein [Phycisphaerales bacterium]